VHEQNSDTWEFGKGALSANVYFFDNHYQAIGAAATQLWVEGGVDDGMVGKICLSGEERLFRISRVTSEALEGRNKRVHR